VFVSLKIQVNFILIINNVYIWIIGCCVLASYSDNSISTDDDDVSPREKDQVM
jgi:hypothetical protein